MMLQPTEPTGQGLRPCLSRDSAGQCPLWEGGSRSEAQLPAWRQLLFCSFAYALQCWLGAA